MRTLSPHPQLSSPGLTGRSSTPRPLGSSRTASEYWIPAFAGMTPEFASRVAKLTN
ncbi:hypothetical protein ACVWYQ_006931 [Bradyrhizobium sp. USDA 3397]